jgi:hypothetical protein
MNGKDSLFVTVSAILQFGRWCVASVGAMAGRGESIMPSGG